MDSWRQTKLLLWKDYLIRKRKFVSLGGAVWAGIVMLSLVIVRNNIDTQDLPTCQYAARALPSAGMLTFLQSFICEINNECRPMEQFEEIPLYANSRIRQLEQQFSPLLYNDTVLDVAAVMPDALKLVATFTNVIDQPTFHQIGRNGVHVRDLFVNPLRVSRYLSAQLNTSAATTRDVMAAEISFEGIFNATFDKCNPDSIAALLLSNNTSSMQELSTQLCRKTDKELELILMQLLPEINYRKYFNMLGEMVSRLNSDGEGVSGLGGLAAAAFRLSRLESFIPTELTTLFHSDSTAVVNVTIITKLMDLFEPTFGDTAMYRSIRGVMDSIVDGLQWLYGVLQRPANNQNGSVQTLSDAVSVVFDGLKANRGDWTDVSGRLDVLKHSILDGFGAIEQIADSVDVSAASVFRVLSRIMNAVVDLLPPKSQHQVLYYSTILTKLVEGAHHTALKNLHMEEIMYNVSVRQKEGVRVLTGLPASVVGKTFDALADAERTQIFTSRISNPGQMFCDAGRLANFLRVSKAEADSLKRQLCNTAWKSYVADIIDSFGIFDVKNNINNMASLVIAETIGKDNSHSLYSIDKDFAELQSLAEDLTKDSRRKSLDWPAVLNISRDSELFEVVQGKLLMAKKILITVHGALAREIVKQNPILEAKITPILISSTTLIAGLNEELRDFPTSLVDGFKNMYADIVKVVLATLLHTDKTFKALSIPTSDALCQGADNATQFLVLPENINKTAVVDILCQLSAQFDRTLSGESKFAATIHSVMHSHLNPLQEINWVALTTQLKNLYITLENHFPYVFAPSTYNMDNMTVAQIAQISQDVKLMWFGPHHADSALHISLKVGFKLLDLLDQKLFNLTNEVPIWRRIKGSVDGANSFLVVTNQLVTLVQAILAKDDSYSIPYLTVTVNASRNIIPNVPELIKDITDVLVADNTSISSIVTLLNARPPWPCSERSMSEVVALSEAGSKALHGVEMLMCLGSDLQREWTEYGHAQNIRNFVKNIHDNTTEFEPHIFLKLSGNFDEFVKDLGALDQILRVTSDDNFNEKRMNVVDAVKYAIKAIRENNENSTLFRKIFTKLEAVLEQIDTSVDDNKPTLRMWEQYLKCSNGHIDEECLSIGRAAWKNTLKFVSVAAYNVLDDLITYFTEVNQPNATLLQIMGFVSGTGLNKVYEKWPHFLGVLLNSYWDYGFMNQIRKASKAHIWDCESIVDALVIPMDSSVSKEDLRVIKPYVCPSVFYWISLPRGENTMLNLVAKTQYYFNTMPVNNLTSSYVQALDKATQFSKLLDDIAKVNISEAVFNETFDRKLDRGIGNFLSWKISETDATYKLFNEVNKKQFISTIYLIKIATIVNKISEAITNISESEQSKALNAFTKLFRRRPTAMMEIYYDAVTDVLWKNDANYNLVNALNLMCDNNKNNDTTKDIMSNNKVVKAQFCTKNYSIFHENNKDFINIENDRNVLISFVQSLQNDAQLESTNMLEFFHNRKDLIKLTRLSMQYSEDLGVGIYIKYLQSNLQHYNIILSFLSGDDWWSELKVLYNGPYATQFFKSIEDCFEIAEDVLTHLDKIKLVRLLKHMDVNSTDMFCLDNVTLSDYVPDATGALSRLKTQLCSEDKTDLFRELPPLLFASQGYEPGLMLSQDVDFSSVDSDIAKVQSKLQNLLQDPKPPQRPSWITDEKLAHFKQVAKNVFSKETVTKLFFGMMYNIGDGVTLFLNNSDPVASSTVTTWLRQINLQLFKKDEYDNLLCHLTEMSDAEIYNNLKTNFHWDMAIMELISERNYTKYELNKAMNQLLEHVSTYVLHSVSTSSASPRLVECRKELLGNNLLANVSFDISVVTKTLRMIRSVILHLEEVDGIKQNRQFVKLLRGVAHRLSVKVPLSQALVKRMEFEKYLKENFTGSDNLIVENMEIDITKVINYTTVPVSDWLIITNGDSQTMCSKLDCSYLADMIAKSIDIVDLTKRLLELQTAEFWKFRWLSDIIQHSERLLGHVANILEVGSRIDVSGVTQGKIPALLDAALTVLQKDNMKTILYSLNGIITELNPLLKGTDLEFELKSVCNGLQGLGRFRDSIVDSNDLTVDVWRVVSTPERMEREMRDLGINHTNFWSFAAPRIHTGRIDFKPLLTTKNKSIHIHDYVCQAALTSQVLLPTDLDGVAADDVFRAVGEQFCDLSDHQIKGILPVVLRSLNITFIFNQIVDTVLIEVYHSSNLTQEEGKRVIAMYSDMVTLMPLIQENLGGIAEMLSKEPLLAELRKADSVKGLLSSSEFLSSAGDMLCGKPLLTDNNRFYKAIAETKDYSTQPDPRQLEALPSDFCRSLYKDILSMGGGKIIWSFVKPLIMGRILYTPNTPTVEQIMNKANVSFAHMSRIRDLISSFSEAFNSIDTLSDHKESLVTLKQLMNSARFRALADSFSKEGSADLSGDFDFAKVLDDFADVKNMASIVKRLSDLLGCINLDRFKPMSDELKLSSEAVRLTMINEFTAGIVFNSEPQLGKVDYKIRMDIESVPTTSRKRNQFWTPGPEASFIENMRYFRGFVQIQDLVDKAIVQLADNMTRHRIAKRHADTKQVEDWAVYTQQMPYPCYKRDVFQASLYESQALIVAFFFALILTVSSAVRFIIHERESGNTTLMSVMGLRISNHTLSWFLSSLVETGVASALMLLVLKLGGILPRSDPWLLWLIVFNFAFSVVTFCYMTSKLFKSASLGSVCTCILYLMMFLPYVIVLSMEAVLGTAQKILICISMCTAFSYSMLYVARYEAVGVGAQWSNAWRSPDSADGMSVASVTLMVLLDALIYTAVGWFIEWFTEYRNRTDNLVNSTTSSEKAGVSIANVSKTYGEGTRREKLALDNVSIELNRGQITTLLGQNGAGKTTLIKIITGMVKPSAGSIAIRTEEGGERGRVKLGVCPQSDVLIESMTPVEHLQFYAMMKSGRQYEHVALEVQSMLHVLSFGALAYERVSRLSGGLRRRLCVALAFICRPQLVLLDEPSSGVDPVARRDTWSLIVKLKEDRTVLMTTHHLDEAELLSDQIVIMHRGRVHTTGSPIEIKRSLGSGYKLTAFYVKLPQTDNLDNEDTERRATAVEELSKELLATVRSVVKNAQLVDVKGKEVEIALPFFDSNGLNNDMLSVCKLLESKQPELRFASYALDCSSLEQVFLAICNQADSQGKPPSSALETDDCEASSSSSSHDYQTGSTNSVKDDTEIVPDNGVLSGTPWQQYSTLLNKRRVHYARNRWLATLLFVVPTVFVFVAMGFSLIRPPADNEVALRLHPDLYGDSTQFLVARPSNWSSERDARFAEDIMQHLAYNKPLSVWNEKDNPPCECTAIRQECDYTGYNETRPQLLSLPDSKTVLDWATSTQEKYIEKRYGGWSSSLGATRTSLVAWYNNKGHHAMPSYVNALSTATLRRVTGDRRAEITTYTHPLKISEEQLSKSTVLQHVADIGISAVILVGFSLVPAGAAIYLVHERESKQKRLQMLCGVSPAVYWLAAVTWDMLVVVINIGLTVCVLEIFRLPVFVEKDNLAAICLLLLLFGWACGNCVHVFEKCFSDPSLANMLIFCLNVFVGISGLAVLLILDIISDSDMTDNARWTLHKVFMLSPQFALGDGLIEIAKNSIQAQVLKRFGMDTYSSPLTGPLISYHYTALALVGLLMFAVNMAIEYDWIDGLLARLRSSVVEPENEMEDLDVATERYRVELAALRSAAVARPQTLHTIGNINAGFVNTEGKGLKQPGLTTPTAGFGDVLQCLSLRKEYSAVSGRRVAVHNLTLGLPAGECVALLGENGAGKSTTFGMLTGELRPSGGQILLREHPVGTSQLRRGFISYCPQNDAIDPLMTVRETLHFYCRLRGISSDDEVIRRTLEQFSLQRYADQFTRTLSGGNKRKLCTAIAMMARTPLVLLDEPTSGMDPGARGVVAAAVARACGAGRSLLLSTHALDDARRLATRLALLQRGRLRTVGPIRRELEKWGGGHVVCMRVSRGGDVERVWGAVRGRLPRAVLQVTHYTTLQFLLPRPQGAQEPLSHIFSELAALQSQYDIEDYTVNQSSLYQMFDNFTEKKRDPDSLQMAPSENRNEQRHSEELTSVTAL